MEILNESMTEEVVGGRYRYFGRFNLSAYSGNTQTNTAYIINSGNANYNGAIINSITQINNVG
ncbi:MAG: hypothetical protein FJX03_05445 [Alphaproteobacteria bacterium]|nr:hypothetical protein [Alphaproteobacteria bacterium]